MHCWARYLLWLVIAMTGAGCGQKGSLYLPDTPGRDTPPHADTRP
jgi:predicted small lipoprotein YifL